MTSVMLTKGAKKQQHNAVLSKKNGIDSSLEKNAILSKKEAITATRTIPEEFKLLDRYWKASNYLSVGQVSHHH